MGDPANVSYSTQHIEELLRCPICLDRYTTPKLLPCQHTFCESPCLEHLVDRFHRIKCPECREEHRVPYAGVSSFPTNRTILNFLDLPTQPHTPPQQTATQNGASAPEAGARNQPTNQNSGPPQNDARSQTGSTNQNGVAQNGNTPDRTGCSACGRQLTLSRCAHCDNIVCDTCKRSHIEQLRLDVNRLVGQLRRGMPNFSQAVSVVESKSEQLHQRAEAGKAEITETIERYISELRNRQRLLHSEVQMWLLGEIRSLRMLQENVEVELASTASFCDSTEANMSRPNQVIPDEDLVDLRRQCVEHLEVCRTYEGGQGVRLPRQRRVEVTFEANRFSQAISNFGELTIIEGEATNGGGNRTGTARTSSSRETSPAVPSGRTGGNASPARQPGAVGGSSQGNAVPSLDTALLAIGSSAAQRRPTGERMGGLMGGGGGPSTSTNENSPRPATRPHPRERLTNMLIGGGDTVEAPRPPQRERTAGMFSGGTSSGDSDSNNLTPQPVRRPVPQPLSWELPVDFSYPPRADIRVGNGNHTNRTTRSSGHENRSSGGQGTSSNTNRRSLQERRRHNLTDPQLPQSRRQGVSRQSTDLNLGRRRSHGNPRNQARQSTSDPIPGSSSDSDNPGPPVRSRTFTREEFQAIREEETASRASAAEGGENVANGEQVTYRAGTVDGGESTRVNMPRNNYQDKGRAIIRFGKRGSNESEFVWPRGIAVSRSDQIYVADSSNHRVQVFDNIGTFVKCFGSYGQDHSEFDCLAGIAMNTMGDILITDRYNHRIQVFDHQGNFKFEFGEEGSGDGQMNYPWGIGCDSMGFIYVCDKENHRIQVFQSNGIFARKFGRLGRGTTQFENPHYLAISADNKVYVSDSGNHRIQVFSMYGDFIFQFGSIGTMQGQMKHPKGIAIDEQGFVLVADSGNNRIQVFRGDGRFYCMFGSYGSDNGQFKGLEGLAVLANGNVAVCDRENHRVQIF